MKDWSALLYLGIALLAMAAVLGVGGYRPGTPPPWVYWRHRLAGHTVRCERDQGRVIEVHCATCQWGRFYLP